MSDVTPTPEELEAAAPEGAVFVAPEDVPADEPVSPAAEIDILDLSIPAISEEIIKQRVDEAFESAVLVQSSEPLDWTPTKAVEPTLPVWTTTSPSAEFEQNRIKSAEQFRLRGRR